MGATMTCAYDRCGRLFEQSRKDQIYCCKQCGKRAYAAAWRDAHREEISIKGKARRAEMRRLKRTYPSGVPQEPAQPRKEVPAGPYISYGKKTAQALLEQQAREMELRRLKFYAELKECGL